MSDPAPENLESLRESRRQLATLISNLPGMVYRCRNDREWTMEFISDGCLALTGYRAADVVAGHPPFSALLVEEERPAVWNQVQNALAVRQPFTLTYRLRTASGDLRWVWEQGRGLFGEDGEVIALEGFITDITDQRSAEERFHRLNRRYSALIRINEASVRIREPRALLEEACRIAVELGRFRAVWIGMRDGGTGRLAAVASSGEVREILDAALHPGTDEVRPSGCLVERALETGHPQFVPDVTVTDEPWQAFLASLGIRGAAALPLNIAGRVIGSVNLFTDATGAFDEDERRLLASLTGDIAFSLETLDEEKRRARLETDLARARSIETLGRLSGGLAHDFNNLVMVIGTCADNLRAIAGEDERYVRELDEIRRACERGTELTRRLLAFGRHRKEVVARVDLGAMARASVEMLTRLLGDEIEVVVEVAEGEHPVVADRTRFEQVLLNLALNGRDAMPDGGRLSIRVETTKGRRPMGGPGGQEGRFVRLTVEDTGTGLTPEIREHLFEPFFTTKATGAGSGLGLSSVREVVRRAGGWIDASDVAEGPGARFEIWLPRTAAED